MADDRRYFTSYTGVKLPLKLIGPLEPEALANRNTYIVATYDAAGRLLSFEKRVYGEVELCHRYQYRDDGSLARAEISIPGEDSVEMDFAPEG